MADKDNCEQLKYFSHIMDSVADGVFTVDRDMHIIAFNRAAELMTGVKRADAVGRPCHEIFRTSVCENGCPVREAKIGRAHV